MKMIHPNKLGAVMEMKLRALFSKNFIIMPIFAVGFTFIMKLVYGSVMSEEGLTDQLRALALSYGALMNVTMTGIYCVSAALAEEKEKHTLRVLMTSSVNGLEFFLGSMIPILLMMMVVNIILVPITGLSMNASEWAAFLGVSALAAAVSAVIGMIFGIFAKNQITAGTITTPALLIFMMIPMFSYFNEKMQMVSDVLFTGVLMQTVNNIANGAQKLISSKSMIVLILEVVIAAVCFLVIYQRNGYDSD